VSESKRVLTFDLPNGYGPWLHVGTCSWKYDSWKGLIYDPNKTYRAEDYLSDYSRKLDSVEVDQWFWSLFSGNAKLPEPRTVKSYGEAVPDSFVFSVKAPNALTLTHHYGAKAGEAGKRTGPPNPHFLSLELLRKFLDILSPWGKKLGPVMFQFEYLNKSKMPTREAFQERFGTFILHAPKGPAYALEIRNPRYFTPEFFAFLKEIRVGFVGLEGYYMPPLLEVFEKFDPRTAPFLVLRLHGSERRGIEKVTGERWDRIVAPRSEALKGAARIVRLNRRQKVMTFLNVNNHFEGSAPLTIDRFLKELEALDT
jgi:uncharacterized protein YecE (DUF72 family)